jgi:ATPase subunit of ABC transporter with duplicated ATPase domains
LVQKIHYSLDAGWVFCLALFGPNLANVSKMMYSQTMSHGEVIVRFDQVSFEYGHNKKILDDVSFSVRRGAKITIMGQNGAGKSTLFGMIAGALKPESGDIFLAPRLTIATARQVRTCNARAG